MPLIVTRHSKQIPIPHKGKRGSPEIERRKLSASLAKIAVATVLPSETVTSVLLIVRAIILLFLPANLRESALIVFCSRQFAFIRGLIRFGEYGLRSIFDSRPKTSSVKISAVPSEVVIPKPSCPQAK